MMSPSLGNQARWVHHQPECLATAGIRARQTMEVWATQVDVMRSSLHSIQVSSIPPLGRINAVALAAVKQQCRARKL